MPPNWYDDLTPQDRLDHANGILDVIQKDVDLAISIREIYRGAADNDDLRSSINKTFAAHAYSLTVDSLHATLIMILMRLHDETLRKNTASLPNFLSLIDDQDSMDAFYEKAIEDASRPGNFIGFDATAQKHIELMREAEAPEIARTRTEKLKNCLQTLREMKGRHEYAALKAFRDQILAHRPITDNRIQIAQYGQADDFLEATTKIVSDLCLHFQRSSMAFEELKEHYEQYALDFWSRFKA